MVLGVCFRMKNMTQTINDRIPDDWTYLGDELECPCGHIIELDGECPNGHKSPLREMGMI